ncbi:hypothetical protein RhiJN_27782 [Ceratobasidium sp. AG-Ba]|nr:hypothetical protein RhiJN_27782 [Ceratobasidium sp. AG-Ba]
MPEWAIIDHWAEGNPELAGESWSHVSRKQKTMTYLRESGISTIHYPLNPCTVVYDCPDLKSLPLIGARAPVPAPGSSPPSLPDLSPIPNTKSQSLRPADVVNNARIYDQLLVPITHLAQNHGYNAHIWSRNKDIRIFLFGTINITYWYMIAPVILLVSRFGSCNLC